MATATKQKWTILARHRNWVSKCVISESVLESDDLDSPSIRRFTATIDGFQGFRLYEGPAIGVNGSTVVDTVQRRARCILARMTRKDDAVFHEKNPGERSEQIEAMYLDANLRPAPEGKYKHLIGIGGKNNGFFFVSNPRQCLDRTVFREIAAEAREAGLSMTYYVYGRTCTYSGPNIEFMQLGAQ